MVKSHEHRHWHAIDVFLFSNGQYDSPPRKYHLTDSELNCWEQTREKLADSHYGCVNTMLEIYTIDGRAVTNPMLLKNGGHYVAVIQEDQFQPGSYQKYMIRASRSWDKRQIRKCCHEQNFHNTVMQEPLIESESETLSDECCYEICPCRDDDKETEIAPDVNLASQEDNDLSEQSHPRNGLSDFPKKRLSSSIYPSMYPSQNKGPIPRKISDPPKISRNILSPIKKKRDIRKLSRLSKIDQPQITKATRETRKNSKEQTMKNEVAPSEMNDLFDNENNRNKYGDKDWKGTVQTEKAVSTDDTSLSAPVAPRKDSIFNKDVREPSHLYDNTKRFSNMNDNSNAKINAFVPIEANERNDTTKLKNSPNFNNNIDTSRQFDHNNTSELKRSPEYRNLRKVSDFKGASEPKRISDSKDTSGIKRSSESKDTSTRKSINAPDPNRSLEPKNSSGPNRSLEASGLKRSIDSKDTSAQKDLSDCKDESGPKHLSNSKEVSGLRRSYDSKDISGLKRLSNSRDTSGLKRSSGSKDTSGPKRLSDSRRAYGPNRSSCSKEVPGLKRLHDSKDASELKGASDSKVASEQRPSNSKDASELKGLSDFRGPEGISTNAREASGPTKLYDSKDVMDLQLHKTSDSRDAPELKGLSDFRGASGLNRVSDSKETSEPKRLFESKDASALKESSDFRGASRLNRVSDSKESSGPKRSLGASEQKESSDFRCASGLNRISDSKEASGPQRLFCCTDASELKDSSDFRRESGLNRSPDSKDASNLKSSSDSKDTTNPILTIQRPPALTGTFDTKKKCISLDEDKLKRTDPKGISDSKGSSRVIDEPNKSLFSNVDSDINHNRLDNYNNNDDLYLFNDDNINKYDDFDNTNFENVEDLPLNQLNASMKKGDKLDLQLFYDGQSVKGTLIVEKVNDVKVEEIDIDKRSETILNIYFHDVVDTISKDDSNTDINTFSKMPHDKFGNKMNFYCACDCKYFRRNVLMENVPETQHVNKFRSKEDEIVYINECYKMERDQNTVFRDTQNEATQTLSSENIDLPTKDSMKEDVEKHTHDASTQMDWDDVLFIPERMNGQLILRLPPLEMVKHL